MSQMHYTREQAMQLQPEISDMVREVIRDGLDKDSGAMGNKKTYKLVTGKETGESVDFEFIFKKNALDVLMGDNALPGVRNIETYRQRPVATATTFLHGRPYAITFQQEDFDRDLEETMQMSIVEECGQHFLEHIVGGMASSWYHHGLHDRISLWNHESNFDAIRDYTNGMVMASWAPIGYAVDVLIPNDADPYELQVVKRDISINALPQHPNPNNKNVDICQRYIDLGIISLIALGYIEKDFSWTLN